MNRVAPASVPPEERIASIDILRGVALFGVMAVNVVTGFRVSIFQQFLPGSASTSSADRLAEAFVTQALEMKAFALFSLLFGVGLAIQYERLSASRRPFYWLARRLAVLLFFGLIHLLLLWNGDILLEYALVGFVVLPFLRAPRFVAMWGCAVALFFYVMLPSMELPIFWPDTPTFARHVAEATAAYATGGYGEITLFGMAELPLILSLHLWVLPRTVGLFLLGILAWRSGMFRDLHRRRHYLLAGAAVCLCFGAALSVRSGVGANPGTVVLALGYSMAVLGLLQYPVGAFLKVFAPTGKMAFTNYILQSLIFGAIFFGWGLGRFGRMGAAQALLIGCLVYVAQMVFSAWWLRRFQYGPLEWLWRTLMYGKKQPMLCSRPVA